MIITVSSIILNFFITLFLGISLNYLLIKNYKILNLTKLLDTEFKKPQSFHKKSTPRIGGLSLYILLLFAIFFLNDKFYYDLFFLSSVCFFIGFADDIKLIKSPKIRLVFLLFFINLIIHYFDIESPKFQIFNLDEILTKIDWLRIFLISICFLFIINGSNFIDGYNGLLIGQFSIILIILNIVNFYYLNYELFFLGVTLLSLSLSILVFNFPKAKLFLGDSGSYLIGCILSYLLLKTSILTKSIIPPFFYACIIYYIFFEVFFSFFRKLIIEKKSPLYPDRKHLHMLTFIFLNKKFSLIKANYKTGLYINLIYIISLIPLMFFYSNFFFLRIYFFLLLISYLLIYFFMYIKIFHNKLR
jgi:UDP-N-acetylmuramyl pentapeptide phosphotransferase/UDP-N-acetylglucosamine-1-phosphate transferase